MGRRAHGPVAGAVASETRSRGIRQVLSPVVNIARDVRWGRVEETYGEDPFLASRMAVAFVRAFETRGVVATPKHFAANVGAGGRDSYPIADGERYLREVDFPPFLAAIGEGGARSIMTAYNSWDGLPAPPTRGSSPASSKASGASGASSSRTPARSGAPSACT